MVRCAWKVCCFGCDVNSRALRRVNIKAATGFLGHFRLQYDTAQGGKYDCLPQKLLIICLCLENKYHKQYVLGIKFLFELLLWRWSSKSKGCVVPLLKFTLVLVLS